MKTLRRIFILLTAICCAAFFFAGCAPRGGEEKVQRVYITVGQQTKAMTLTDNASAKAFYQKLKEGDLVIVMNDYGNFEKVGALGFSLPKSDRQIKTKPGDVILYLGSEITIYYDVNTWSFTLLGSIPDMTRESMLAFLGGAGEVSVTFSLQEENA